MQIVTTWIVDRWNNCLGDAWRWFNTLNTEEWLLVLAAVCAVGFLFMRGSGSRANA
ncbi:hypothetical protein Pla175_16420 [Pirellulimonas nuda]|uniref:Uncharacterized protein n=1 Tax=Pirellulimonas nuda TaxID=2528009 RepID=A0A518DA05_9BACT|nr:hypothetical protein [Pirellulimonas nuda]QDU88268.1 hypothetical protein Pla175_16420 [Pirellulimonas nuda]